MLKHRARTLNQAHVYPLGALTVGLKGETITEMGELTEAGCIGFSHADAALVDTQVLLRALQYAATFGYRVWLRPQDAHLARGGVAHDGAVATRLGLPACRRSPRRSRWRRFSNWCARPARACIWPGCRPHDGVGARARGEEGGLAGHLRRRDPPRAPDRRRHRLVRFALPAGAAAARSATATRSAPGLADGTIDAICSDHTPVDDDAKQLPFAEAEPGATGLELLLPLTLKWAQEDGLPLVTALARITAEPARALGLAAGQLRIGADADVCVFDPMRAGSSNPRRSRARARTRRFSESSWPERCAIRWWGERSSTRHHAEPLGSNRALNRECQSGASLNL